MICRPEFKLPGKHFLLGGRVPTAIVDDHNEVSSHWFASGIRKAFLFRVDAHPDMNSGAPVIEYVRDAVGDERFYYMFLDIDRFMPPAFFYDVVSAMWWLNPHSKQRTLQYMGSSLETEKERHIWAYQSSKWYGYDNLRFYAECDRKSPFFDNQHKHIGVVKRIEDILVPSDMPVILDIEYDAFCCNTEDIAGVSERYLGKKLGVVNYVERINLTMEMIAALNRVPDLITISKAKGQKILAFDDCILGFRTTVKDKVYEEGKNYIITPAFVPAARQEEIETLVLEGLIKVLL